MLKGQEREKRLLKKDYYSDSYFRDVQLYSFVEQLKQVNRILNMINGKNIKILEVGKGNGFVSSFIKNMGYNITTFDINPNLDPDIVGDILSLSQYFKESEFDLVICSEVLEHMELDSFTTSLKQISYVTSHYAFITLPEYKSFSGVFMILRVFNKVKKLSFIFPTKAKHSLPKEHFWEIDSSNNTKLNILKRKMMEYFNIIDHARFMLNPYHNYFILEKK